MKVKPQDVDMSDMSPAGFRITRISTDYAQKLPGHWSQLSYIVHSHKLVRATNERFLPTWATFRDGLASESHWMPLVLEFTVHCWPAPISVGGLLDNVGGARWLRRRVP